MKTCSKCGMPKSLFEFYKDKRAKDGLHSQCKICRNEGDRKRQSEHPEKRRESRRRWQIENPEKVREANRKWRYENKERQNEYTKDWRSKHRESCSNATRRWQIKNPEKAKELHRKANAKKRSTVRGKLNTSMVSGIIYSIKKGSKAGRHWEDIVGFTVEQLKKHLEKRFKPGMTWENYGSYWEIDHKIPISAFNFERPENLDFRRCWSLKNLQPMENTRNRSKGAMIEKPFQPSLVI